MCLAQSQVMEVIGGRPVDGALGGKRASAKLVHKILAVDICREAKAVLRAEIVVYTSIIRVFRVSLGVRKGKAPNWIRQTVSPVICACTCSHGTSIGTWRTAANTTWT